MTEAVQIGHALEIAPGDRLIDLKEVKARTSLSTSTIYRRRGRSFPNAYTIGDSRVAWLLSEVEQWMREQIARAIDENGSIQGGTYAQGR